MNIASIPVGSLVWFGGLDDEDLSWRKVTPENDLICLRHAYRCFDMREPDNKNGSRRNHGNNFYPHSNIRLWLNSDSDFWYAPQHDADNGPVKHPWYRGSAVAGFLSGFSSEERAAIIPRAITVGIPRGSRGDYKAPVQLEDLVTLPSVSEFGFDSPFEDCDEGDAIPNLREYAGTYRTSIMTRTGSSRSTCSVVCASDLTTLEVYCTNNTELCPMLRLNPDTEFTRDGGEYYFSSKAAPTLADILFA